MSALLAHEVLCPNCGAALGSPKPGSEYTCTFCGHRSATPGRPPEPEAGAALPAADPSVAEALRLHLLWYGGYAGGVRADFTGAQLSGVSLAEATLAKAILAGAMLRHADLSGANLDEADLAGANLEYANLKNANFVDANLSGANLSRADMTGTILVKTRLSGADLQYAQNVNLSGARFWRAKLGHATVVGGSTARRFVAGLDWWALPVVVAIIAAVAGAWHLSGAKAGSLSSALGIGPNWDNVGGPPIVAAVGGGEVVVGRLRNLGRDDLLFVGGFDGATAAQRWKLGPFGTYGQAYRSTHFTVSGPYVVVTDFHAKAHVYDLATGAERHTVALTDRIDDAASLWPIPPDKVGLKQVDQRTTILDLATGAATNAPPPVGSAPRTSAPPSDEVDLQSLPRIPNFARVHAYRGDGTIVLYGHKSPGTPTPMVVGLDVGATSPRWQVPLATVDPATVRNDDLGLHTSAAHGDRFVGIYGVGQRAWHMTAFDTQAGARQWDVVLRPIFAGDEINGLVLSASRVYVARQESLEVHDAANGALIGTIGGETYR